MSYLYFQKFGLAWMHPANSTVNGVRLREMLEKITGHYLNRRLPATAFIQCLDRPENKTMTTKVNKAEKISE